MRSLRSDVWLEGLKSGVLRGERRDVSKALTLVGSEKAEDRESALIFLESLWEEGVCGKSKKVGFTGGAGAGKSSLIGVLGERLAKRGERLAVLCVDPSSPVSGGSILGDRVRMTRLVAYEHVFVRGLASGGHEGGLSRSVSDAITVCEAAGFDKIFVESGGVGQSQTAIRHVVDFLLLLVAPGGGDDVQAMKRGLLELVDGVVVSKDDGIFCSDVSRTVSDLRVMLGLGGKKIAVVRSSVEEEGGLEEVEKLLEEGLREGLREERRWACVEEDLRMMVWSELERNEGFLEVREEMKKRVEGGEIYPGKAVRELWLWLKEKGFSGG